MEYLRHNKNNLIRKRKIGMATILVICIIVLAVKLSLTLNSETATPNFSLRNDSALLFGSKTAYKFIGNYDTTVIKPVGCQAVQLNMVERHGTRNPSQKYVTKRFPDLALTLNRLMKFNSSGKASTVHIQFPWVDPFKSGETKEEVDAGDNECYGIGHRYAERFPGILKQNPIPISKFKFISTTQSRTAQGAIAFIMGYFQGKGNAGPYQMKAAPLITIPDDRDTLLHYYEFCPKYTKEVLDNKSAFIQEKKFLSGSYVNQTVIKVRKRLGLDGVSEVSVERVLAMHIFCSFDIAVFGKTEGDGWCSVFDKDDFNVLNYALDLRTYYEEGPAYEISYKISCVLLRDIFLSLQARAGKAVQYEKYDVHFRSAHSNTILPLYSLMGLVTNKTPLLADNFDKMSNRDFKTGEIVPFAANIAFVLYECENGDLKIQMYSNEYLIQMPCCKSKIDCSFSEFEKYYQNIVDQCDLNKMCKMT